MYVGEAAVKCSRKMLYKSMYSNPYCLENKYVVKSKPNKDLLSRVFGLYILEEELLLYYQLKNAPRYNK